LGFGQGREVTGELNVFLQLSHRVAAEDGV
jgi:hypothetical protein